MISLLGLIDAVVNIFIWIVIFQVVLSWLITFKVINMHNRFVYAFSNALYRLTEPVLRPIRRFLPDLGGIDLSPVILILLLYFGRSLLHEYWPR